MKIKLRNCNNIAEGEINIEENRLNILYGINGTGKSTIAKAIFQQANGGDLTALTPFKHRDKVSDSAESYAPRVEGVPPAAKPFIFNEEYLNQYLFKQDELIQNSFEIFVKTAEYDRRYEEIERQIAQIKATFSDSQELQQLEADLRELSDCFGKAKSGYSAAGSIGKALGGGNKVEHIPPELTDYRVFLTSTSNVQWVKWQTQGGEYLALSDHCPYCTSSVAEQKDKIMAVAKEYDPKTIEHLNKVLSVFTRLGRYFTKTTNDRIAEITRNINGITDEQKNFLLEIKKQVDILIEKLINLKQLGFFNLKDVGKVVEHFSKAKIELSYLAHLDTEDTSELTARINTAVDSVLSKAGLLQGEVNKQNKLIRDTITSHSEDINDFLRSAGYKYSVGIEFDGKDQYKMKLRHSDADLALSEPSKHLSYGERNAFSLILFMHEVLSKGGDLIILDDPISSFDKNKKFAVVNRLFRTQNSFQGKTVIMLTHDFEPVVDTIYTLPGLFTPVPRAAHLAVKQGKLNETEIERTDIKTFHDIAKENIHRNQNLLCKLIYLRRLLELDADKNEGYEIISNIFHKRDEPLIRAGDNGALIAMPADAVDRGVQQVQEYAPDFDYAQVMSDVRNQAYMIDRYERSPNNYERLQLYRILFAEKIANKVIKKFVDEAFHIENDYIMQLNPYKYELIPEYVVDVCNIEVNALKAGGEAA